MRTTQLALIALAATAPGCENRVTLDLPSAPVTTPVTTHLENRALDVLFVIDNTLPMGDIQTAFAEAMPTLLATPGPVMSIPPDVHIGVITSSADLGNSGFGDCPTPDPLENGLLQNAARIAGCTPPSGRYILDLTNPDGTRTANYNIQSPVSDVLACVMLVGAAGCRYVAPLEAMRRALDGSVPDNEGFLRSDADLAIIILANEDDCSVANAQFFAGSATPQDSDLLCQPLAAYDCDQPISATTPGTYTNCKPKVGGFLYDPDDYVQFLANLKPPGHVSVAVIAGDPSSTLTTTSVPFLEGDRLELVPSCATPLNGTPIGGGPGIRLGAFEHAFGERGGYESICQPDYADALTAIGASINAMRAPCLEGNLSTADTDATNPGLQPACTVTASPEVAGDPGVVIEPCAMQDATTPLPSSVQPCWWVEHDLATCPSTSSGMLMHVPVGVGSALDAVCAVVGS